jgi:hypothetical protein
LMALAAGGGWAAHDLTGRRAVSSPADPPAATQPAYEPIYVETAPPTPRLIQDGRLTFEDGEDVRAFFDLSVRCGLLAGEEYRASVFDLLSLRAKGAGGYPFTYKVTQTGRDGHRYVVVQERIQRRDGRAFPGLPGDLVHTYYYDDARARFELVETRPDGPGFDPHLVRAQRDPLSFLGGHAPAVCHNKIQRAARGKRPPSLPPRTSTSAQAAGMAQWSDGPEVSVLAD